MCALGGDTASAFPLISSMSVTASSTLTGVNVELSISSKRVRMSVLLRTVVTSLRSKNALRLTLVNVRVGASMKN